MRPIVARGITYTVLAGMTWAALQVTPPVAAKAGDVLNRPSAAIVSAVGLSHWNVPTVAVAPAVVHATLLNRPDTIALTGTIHSSLIESLNHLDDGELPARQRSSVAFRLADIFEYRIDMSRDLNDGDKFNILVERLQQPSGTVVVNKILGAQLSLGHRVFEAIHFKSRDSNSEWFDGKGKSLKASFMRAPVEFRRITSGFGLREHPILGTWRNHTGTDYSAPMGTPVRAIGDGVVVSAGWMGGYGNVVDIRHSNGYVSRYGHLSGLARGAHRGAHVGMGSTIGYVGMTGWATGPHLHFEVRVNGIAHDPRVALQGKSGDPLPASEARLFQEIRAHTIAALAGSVGDNGIERVAVNK